jgi:hypothetical protein
MSIEGKPRNDFKFLSMSNKCMFQTTNWQQEILDHSVELENKLVDIKDSLTGKGLAEEYSDALTKVRAAREAVHHLIGSYNRR